VSCTHGVASALYRLTTVDGEEVHLTAAEFLADNEILAGTEVETAIRSLCIGETYSDGGGAAPEWSIKRVTPAEIEHAQGSRHGHALSTGTRPISKTKKVRHFSTSENKLGVKSYYVTYENLGGHPITREEFVRYNQARGWPVAPG